MKKRRFGRSVMILTVISLMLISAAAWTEIPGGSRRAYAYTVSDTAGSRTGTALSSADRKGGSASQDQVTIVMIGDMLIHDKVMAACQQSDGSYDFDELFKHVKKETQAADIAMVNQETILGGRELRYSGYPSFNSPTEVGDAEAKAGFDVILQGTNHALDRGARGVENCLSFWKKSHPDIEVLGIHDSEKDKQDLCVIVCKGIRIAILNYTYGTNGIQMPKGKGYLVDYLDEKRVREDLKRAEEQADITIVCPHWGTEYVLEKTAMQEKWAKIFLEGGADLCIGTHPHVIGPMEALKDDKGHEMQVYYSLGNFANYTSGTGSGVMNRMVGGMAEIKIGRDIKGAVKVIETGVKPLVCHLAKDEVTVYYLEDYTESLAKENLIRLQDPSFSLGSCEKLVDKLWGGHR